MRLVIALRLGVIGCGFAGVLSAGSALAAPTTLQDALIEAYNSNPTLQAERANLRATDEDVPQAVAGWRPTITITGSAGFESGTTNTSPPASGTYPGAPSTNTPFHFAPFQGQVQLTQSLFAGGGTRAAVHHATDAVYAERANLMATEESVFAQAISDYVTVIEDQQLLALDQNNQQVLAEQLKATQDRFRVGELTQTDVAQAQAALDQAISEVATATGNLASANAAYGHDIGSEPTDLAPPPALSIPQKTSDEVSAIAAKNNANVIKAQFTVAAEDDNVEQQFAALLPQINAELVGTRDDNTTQTGVRTDDAQALLAVTVPIYQGGAEYSKVRQAKEQVQQAEQQLIDARLAAVSSAVQSYESLISNQAAVVSDRSEIAADQIALSGVEREALVGTATTLDVLIVEQDLLQARTSLVQNLAQAVASSYGVASAMGQLTARDLALDLPLYDETEYYDSVRNKLFGVSVPNPAGGSR